MARIRIYDRIMQSPLFRDLERLSKNVYLNKKYDVSIYRFIIHLRKELIRNHIFSDSKGVAFDFTLAIFPSIIFLFTLIPYIPIEQLDVKIMTFLEEVMPTSMYAVTSETIQDIVGNQRSGLLSLGFVFALYLATNGMMGLMGTFNKCYRTLESRNFFVKRFIATMLTLVLAMVLFCAVILIVFGTIILDFLVDYGLFAERYSDEMIFLIQYGAVGALFFIAISLIYYFAPAVTHRWSFFSLGSMVASVLTILISVGFSFYINNFATYNKVYGSIGTLIGVMIWLQLVSFILLIGFEINAAIDAAKREFIKSKTSEN